MEHCRIRTDQGHVLETGIKELLGFSQFLVRHLEREIDFQTIGPDPAEKTLGETVVRAQSITGLSPSNGMQLLITSR